MDNLPFLSDSFQDSFFSFNVVHSVHCCFTLLFLGLVLALTLILEVLAIISGRFLPLNFFPLFSPLQLLLNALWNLLFCLPFYFISFVFPVYFSVFSLQVISSVSSSHSLTPSSVVFKHTLISRISI